MTETESVDQAGRFTGRDLSRFASRRAVLLSALFSQDISGLASWIFAHNPDPTRPMRGSSPTVLAESFSGDLPMLRACWEQCSSLYFPFFNFSEPDCTKRRGTLFVGVAAIRMGDDWISCTRNK